MQIINPPSFSQTVPVDLGDDSYPIWVGKGLISQVGGLISEQIDSPSKVAIIADTRVAELFGDQMTEGLRPVVNSPIWITVPAGDQNKSIEWFIRVQDALIEHQLDRQSVIIAFGGGVIGDLAGFVASTYMRGIRWIQVPTTLLAQVDASVGGKTAINHSRGKNLIGSFHQPKLVLIDVETLDYLPEREVRCGLVEIIKHGVIMDESLFELVEQNLSDLLSLKTDILIEVIAKSCRNKAWVVENDEKERNLRATLNYGHTFGHAIETLTDYHQCRHGEAVAIGMNCAAQLSVNLELLHPTDLVQQNRLLQAVGLPLNLSDLSLESISAEDLLQTMYLDKKSSRGTLKLVLVQKIGQAKIHQDISDSEILKAIEMCRKAK